MLTEELHYSRSLEKILLGSVLLEPTAFGRMYGIVKPEVFYYDFHQTIFRILSEMWEMNEPIDIATATYYLHKKGLKEIDHNSTAWYIVEITKPVCSTANIEFHSVILRQMYVEREMIKITTGGMMGKGGFEYMDEINDKLMKLRQIKVVDDFKMVDEILIDLYKHMDAVKDRALAGITTGFKTVDKITGGLENGGMYIVAARPSVGKSAFMGQMVLGAAVQNKHVGVISLEMDNKKLTARMASIVSDVEFWRINRNRMYDERQSAEFFYRVQHHLSHLPIRISDTASVNIGDIKSKVARLKQRGQLDILFIDYLGLIDTDGSNRNQNREQEVSKISRGIKLMAMQYEIPIVILCQLNRLSEQSGGEKKPKLHNLRESGSLEQDADGVLFIHRDFMSGIKEREGNTTENEADIIIAKWRNGELADLKVGFDGPKMKFYELEEDKPVYHSLPPAANFRRIESKENSGFDDNISEAAPF